MTALFQPPAYLVYLLHFDAPVGAARHYLGICKSQRLHRRQMQHKAGNGAALTKRAAEQGIGWTVVRLWATDDPALERKLKDNGHLAQHCPLCNQVQRAARFHLIGNHYQPKIEGPRQLPLAWPDSPKTLPADDMKKERNPVGPALLPLLGDL